MHTNFLAKSWINCKFVPMSIAVNNAGENIPSYMLSNSDLAKKNIGIGDNSNRPTQSSSTLAGSNSLSERGVSATGQPSYAMPSTSMPSYAVPSDAGAPGVPSYLRKDDGEIDNSHEKFVPKSNTRQNVNYATAKNNTPVDQLEKANKSQEPKSASLADRVKDGLKSLWGALCNFFNGKACRVSAKVCMVVIKVTIVILASIISGSRCGCRYR
jgi:hypothetical protein